MEQWQHLLDGPKETATLPADDAVDQLLHHLGDDIPVDDFEADRRSDRSRFPRDAVRRG